MQRKIFHLFRHTGTGATFSYEPPPRFNSEQCGFGGSGPSPSIFVTEKWDGTTMQATSTHIFKRLDLWGERCVCLRVEQRIVLSHRLRAMSRSADLHTRGASHGTSGARLPPLQPGFALERQTSSP